MADGDNMAATRRVLATLDDVHSAVLEVAAAARRTLAIFTQDLEPQILDRDDFLEIIKRLVLPNRFARVRVLVADPTRAIKDGHRLVSLGRRLSTYIDFRNVDVSFRDEHNEAFMIADDRGLVFRPDASRWEGIADINEPRVSRKYLDTFDQIWHASATDTELHQLHL